MLQPRALPGQTWWESSPCLALAVSGPSSWWSSWGWGSAATSARRGGPGSRSERRKEKLSREDQALSQTQNTVSGVRYEDHTAFLILTIVEIFRKIKSHDSRCFSMTWRCRGMVVSVSGTSTFTKTSNFHWSIFVWWVEEVSGGLTCWPAVSHYDQWNIQQ